MNTASGYRCPECKSHGPHSVLTYLKDDEGYLIGVRLHCLRCEHSWSDYDDEP